MFSLTLRAISNYQRANFKSNRTTQLTAKSSFKRNGDLWWRTSMSQDYWSIWRKILGFGLEWMPSVVLSAWPSKSQLSRCSTVSRLKTVTLTLTTLRKFTRAWNAHWRTNSFSGFKSLQTEKVTVQARERMTIRFMASMIWGRGRTWVLHRLITFWPCSWQTKQRFSKDLLFMILLSAQGV